MKRNIPYSQHEWEKQNLVTIVNKGKVYDLVKCKKCGLVGKRHGFNELVEVNKKVKPCTANYVIERPQKVKIIYDGGNLGVIPNEIYDVVDCPKEYKGKFDNDVWVFSQKRKEPVRLLSGEYQPIN